MTAYPSWTPASRPGIVPLHPYGFGTILGRSFVALRHNPKVLLGFALVVQAVAYIVVTAAIAGVAIASFSRLDTVPYGSDDYDAIIAGSIALTAIAALVLGILSGVLGVVVQGIVVAEVAHAVVAEKPSLRAVWARVRPVFWRLVGYSALTVGAVVLLVGVLAGIVALLVIAATWVGALVGVLFFLALIPLYLWLTPKLFLVPSVIILERAPVFRAIARSWQLTRGRFWSTLGVVVIISVVFGVVAQIISLPLSLFGGFVPSIIAPTGESGAGALVGLIVVQVVGQFGILLVQCIALVVQSTSAVLVYVDARMRVEGLDHDLQSYVEARDSGAAELRDPYLVGVGRVVERPAPVPYGAPPAFAGYGPPAGNAGYGAPATGGYAAAPRGYAAPRPVPGYAPSAPAAAPTPPPYAAPVTAPAPQAYPAPPVPPVAQDSPAAPPAPGAPDRAQTTWAAPGSNGDA
ncbi:membrane-anchored glycerophosphoryl diester phosphodiesterase (GDPDase) [Microbacterium sp. AG157]|uniref:glycerophosphoryl diester phosphodiesterase membrane domain-containing protein n=1 Tax=Microbacterium sp. AG157 TaxID=2183993 RepID=UPI000E232439|nr:glycerophosphoryl diester phosphodiesterase membrane domain-containing protein [Microbacterium sp. AG157]REC99503.1 membrane-anchored glycerophosphoryl diester phosphodiesterase (GDPDase) [Microbacterium sp. AG157]